MIALSLLLACQTPEPQPRGPRLVLLVSFDTTRADALSPYAAPDADPMPRTDVAAGLAKGGVRFANALSNAPTTLSAHSALMTGLDSHKHQVVRNGYPLPEGLPTLAERFAAAGWDTQAVVGAVPLAEEMGLARGFRVYEDFDLRGQEAAVGADRVRARALEMAGPAAPERDLLLFVHFYDPHTPWVTAPEAFVAHYQAPGYAGALDGSQESIQRLVDARRAGPLPPEEARQARALYLAQVSFTDVNLGALLEGLAARGWMQDALVVLTADHGETMDEDAEQPYGHGADLDLVDLHVPLILYGAGAFALPAGAVVERPVRLQDVGPTALGVAGLAPALGEGVDLSPLWSGGDVSLPPLLVEATQPASRESTTAWNNLPFARGAADEAALWTTSAEWQGREAQLIGITENQTLEDPVRAARLQAAVQAWDAAAPAHRTSAADAEMEEALRLLGYRD